MSRIAIDARIYSSGTGRYMRELIAHLEAIDNNNDYLILLRTKDLSAYKPTNPRFKAVEADFKDYSFGEQLGLNGLLRQLKPDLVHFCMPQQPLLYTKPAVTTVHDLNLLRITDNDDMGSLELRVKKLVFRGLLWIVARRASRIIVPSNYTKEDLQRFSGIGDNKITLTYEGAAQPAGSPKPVAAYQNVPFIMYLGRAEPYKNNRGLIEAHQQLLAKHPDLRLVIASTIDVLRKSDMAWVEKQGYKNIDFVGFVPDEESAWLYANARCYIHPSFMEGFGLPGLEAMANGAALVSSNATCLPEVYGDAAHYFDPHKPGDMARAIEDVLSNDDLRQQLVTKGPQKASQYSWRRMAEQTLAVYTDVLAARRP